MTNKITTPRSWFASVKTITPLLAILLGAVGSAPAATYIFTNQTATGTYAWSTAANWSNGVPAAADTTTVVQIFSNTTALLPNGNITINATPATHTNNIYTLSGKANGTAAAAKVGIGATTDQWYFDGTTPTINLNTVINTATHSVAITNWPKIQLNKNIIFTGAGTVSSANGGGFYFPSAISGVGFALTKSGASELFLSGANLYSGPTTNTAGILVLKNATALPGGIGVVGGSNIFVFNGGTLGLANGNFLRNLGTGVSNVLFTGNGGWAAYTADRVVNLGNDSHQIAWATATTGFNGQGLLFGSAGGDKMVDFQNAIDLGTAVRTVTVVSQGNATLEARLSGSIGGSAGCGLIKTNQGGLILSAANTYPGTTTIGGGCLVLSNATALPGGIGVSGGTSALTFNSTPANFGTLGLGDGDFTRNLGAAGTATAVNFTQSGGWSAYGADRVVNLNNDKHQIVWGDANTGFNGQQLIFGSASSTHMVDFQNDIDLGTSDRLINVNNGAAYVDAQLSGSISGTGGLKFGGTGAGNLLVSGNNTFSGDFGFSTSGSGTIIVNAATNLGVGANFTIFQNDTLLTTATFATGRGFVFGAVNNVNQDVNVTNGTTFTVNGVCSSATGVLTNSNWRKTGGGTLVLANNANTFSNKTVIFQGSLSVTSIKNVGVASALGQPINSTNGTIALGSGANGSTSLIYTGSGDTSDRIVDLAGTSAGATFTIDQSGTGRLKFTSPVTNTGAASKTLLLQGSTAGIGELGNAIMDNSVANTLGLTKAGTGIWVLSGTTAHTGATTINEGTLVVNGTLGSGTTVYNNSVLAGTGTIAAGVTNNPGGTISAGENGVGTLTMSGDLMLQGGGTLLCYITNGASTNLLVVNGTLNPSGSTAVSIPNAAGLANGDYTLISAATLNGAPGNFDASGSTPLGKTFTMSYQANKVVLTVADSSGAALTWAGQGTDWDINLSDNWSNAVPTLVKYNEGDAVTFDDAGLAQSGVVIPAAVTPLSVVVSNTTGTYSFSGNGKITGATGLTKNGAGVLTLATTNDYTGQTVLNAGQINLNSPEAIGSGSLTIADGTTLDNTSAAAVVNAGNNGQNWNGDFTFVGTKDLNLGSGGVALGANRNVTVSGGNLTVGGSISGGYSLKKSGAGTLTLAGANSFSGNLTNMQGTLEIPTINNASAAGPLGNNANAVVLGSSGNTATLKYTGASTSTTKKFTAATGGTAVFNVTNASTILTNTGVMDGSGNISKTGVGALRLNAGNTFSGDLALNEGILIAGGANTTCLGAGTLTLNTGELQFTSDSGRNYGRNTTVAGNVTLTSDKYAAGGAGQTYTLGTLGIGSQTLTVQAAANPVSGTAGFTFGAVTLSGAPTFLVNNNGLGATTLLTLGAINNGANLLTFDGTGNSTVSGVIGSGAGGLVKNGSGTLTLSGANTYTGSVSINAGSVSVVSVNTNLGGTGIINLGSGATSGTLVMAPLAAETVTRNINLAGTTGGGTLQNNAAIAVTFTGNIGSTGAGSKTLTLNGSGSAGVNRLDGIISDNGGANPTSVLLNGSGVTWLLSGDNTFSGGVTLNSGSLRTGSAHCLGTGTFTLNGGTWNGNADVTITNPIVISGNAAGNNLSALTEFSGNITGTGNWVVNGFAAGKTTLSGNNMGWTGSYRISGANTLRLNHTNALGAGATFTFSDGVEMGHLESLVDISGGAGLTNNMILGLTGAGGSTSHPDFKTTANLKLSGVVSGPAGIGILKTGAGTLTLANANTYSGPTVVSAGTLRAANVSALGSGPVTLNAGATLALSGSVNLANNLTNNGGTIVFGLTNAPGSGNDQLNVAGSVTNTGTTYIALRSLAGGVLDAGTYLLMTNAATLGASSYALAQAYPNVTLNVTATSLTLTVGGGGTILPEIWAGDGVGNAWDVATTANWVFNPGDSPVGFTNGSAVTFDDSSLNPTVNLGTTVLPASVTVNAANNYIIQGAGDIGGTASLTKSGAGILKLAGANDYSGGTVLNAGSVFFNSNNAVGSGVITFNNGNGGFSAVDAPVTLANPLNLAADINNFGISGGGGAAYGFSTNLTVTGDVNLNGAAKMISVRTSKLFLSGLVTNGGVNFNGNNAVANWLVLSNANTYAGGTSQTNGGTLFINHPAAIGSGTLTFGGTVGTIHFDNSSGAGITLANNNAQSWDRAFTFDGTTNLNLGAGAVTLGASITATVSANTLTVGGAVGGAFTLTKAGSGTLELDGADTYNALTLSGGTVTLAGNRTAAFAGSLTAGNGTLNLHNGNFSLAGNTLFVGSSATATVNHTNGSYTFSSGTELLIGNAGMSGLTATYNLSGGSIGSSGGTATSAGVRLGVNQATLGNQGTAIFNLSGSGVINMPGNILQIGRSDSSASYYNATFNQTGGTATFGYLSMGGNGASGSTNINAVLNLTGGTFYATNFNFLSAGKTNTAAITIGGTADVTLPAFPTTRGTDSTATIAFNGGVLRPYASSVTYLQGLNSATLSAIGANLDVGSGKAITIAQPLANAPAQAGVLTKSGSGSLTLSGGNTYTGQTTVSNGTLLINGSLANSSAAVKNGAVLGGVGTINNLVTVESGGKLSAGNGGAGILTVAGNLDLTGATLLCDITNTVDMDKIMVTGDLNPSGVTTIDLGASPALTNGYYTLIEVTGTLGGSAAANFTTTGAVGTKLHSIIYSGNNVVLHVESMPTDKTWVGDGLANAWDNYITPNWVVTGGSTPYLFTNNDTVTFGDTTNLVVDITTTVEPAWTLVNSASNYVFAGSFGIAGTNNLTKGGPGTLVISNANTFTGTVDITNGTLVAANSAALGASGSSVVVGINTNLGATVALLGDNLNLNHPLTVQGPGYGGNVGALRNLSGTNTWSGDIAILTPVTVSTRIFADAGSKLIITGNITNVNAGNMNFGGSGDGEVSGKISGSGGPFKSSIGTGTWTFSGNNDYTGGTTVGNGTVIYSGSLTNASGGFSVNAVYGVPGVSAGGTLTVSGAINTGTGSWTAGTTAGRFGVINIVPGANVAINNLDAGTVFGAGGAVNVTGGNLRTTAASGLNNFRFGAQGYAAFTQTGGTVTTPYFALGYGTGSGGIGIGTLSGGTFNCTTAYVLIAQNGTGVVTVATGGTLVHSNAANPIAVGNVANGHGELNLTGGTIDNTLTFVNIANQGFGVGYVNLNAGLLKTDRFTGSASAHLNFAGATLLSSSNTTIFLPSTVSTYVNGAFGDFVGGAVIDTAGNNNTVGANLLAPTGDGVTSIPVLTGGSGYIGAPYVSITGGGGANATAIAEMADDGTGSGLLRVNAIKITNPGTDYTGAPTVTLYGGSATNAATLDTATIGASSSGGLTKLGAGVLTLTGASTYTGATVVSNGTLLVNGSLASGSAVTVKNAATLGGAGNIGGAVTFESGSHAVFTNGATLTIGGSLNVSGADVYLGIPANLAMGNYTLATYSVGGSSGSFNATPVILPGGSLVANSHAVISTAGGVVQLQVLPNTLSTTLSLASSVNPSVYGQLVTFTATVRTNGVAAGNATSNVVFSVAGSPVFTNAVSGGQAQYSTSVLGLGTHVVGAQYLGDANYLASTAVNTNQVVNVVGTTTNLDLSVSGSTVTLTWPGSHLGWVVQSNAVDLASEPDWHNIDSTTNGTSYNAPVDPAQPNVFYRLRTP